jgi:hypothetical protein
LDLRRNHAATGAGIGAIAGVGIFFISVDQIESFEGGPGYLFFALIPIFGLTGAGIGALMGSGFTRWDTVYEHNLRWGPDRIFEYEPGVGYRQRKRLPRD